MSRSAPAASTAPARVAAARRVALCLGLLGAVGSLLACDSVPLQGEVEAEELVRATERYLWRTGDDPAFLHSGDDAWVEGSPERRAFADWPGVGWFRFFVEVAPEAAGMPIALRVMHDGPADIYFDGRLIVQRGQPASTAELERAVFADPNDLLVLVPEPRRGKREADGGRLHTVTVRYSSQFLSDWRWRGFSKRLSVEAKVADHLVAARIHARGLRTTHRSLLGAASVAFALPFLAIAALRRNVDFSTWFGLVALMVALCVVVGFAPQPILPQGVLTKQALFLAAFLGLAYSVVRLTHSEHSREPTWILRIFFVAALPLLALALLQPFRAESAVLLFMLAAMIEVVRSIVLLRRSRAEERSREDSWLVAVGSVPILVTGMHAVLAGLDLVPELVPFSVFPAPYYASLILTASMSIYLAFDFVRTQRRLEEQVVRVRELSDEALEQERVARRRAVRQARLEAEHARKTAELEEARQLQLSMLPQQLPSLPGLDLAVDTRTATEVGGDYYDAALEPDGALLLAIGDAAGHGVQAGTVVAATKSLVQASVGDETSPTRRLERMATALRRSRLHRRHMALILARVVVDETGCGLELAGAAMPPAYLVRARGTVDAIELPGLPLGSFGAGPFPATMRRLEAGDALVFVSDGVVEAVAEDGQVFGFARLERLVESAARCQSAAAIVEHVLEELETFTGGGEPNDDRTLLVLRVAD